MYSTIARTNLVNFKLNHYRPPPLLAEAIVIEFIVMFLAVFLGTAASSRITRNRSKKKPWQMGVTKSAWER